MEGQRIPKHERSRVGRMEDKMLGRVKGAKRIQKWIRGSEMGKEGPSPHLTYSKEEGSCGAA